ncbi:unnamed protein product [Fraxinus pennsylvanica]|uniref:Oleosin n=1 Tax=Fraxinus pennsylvanica TaxID=56036 RepID=A0AAD1ZTV7_9LAMI|nr:unnamed protein product [Fraxinus pennsylvanica]
MSDQQKPMSQRLQDSAPSSGQAMRFLSAATIGGVLLGLSGLALTGTVIALIIATPVLVLVSPILIPAGIVLFLVTVGFLFAGGCGVVALAALSWIYNYVAGKHPPGSDQLDYARMRIANKARDVKERAKESENQLSAATIGGVLLGLSGLALTGTVIALIIATPVLVLVSPILIPAGIVLFLVTAGFLFAGGCGVVALAALSWIYNYVAGKHPPGSDQLDYARMRIANKARDVKERAKQSENQVQQETGVQGS